MIHWCEKYSIYIKPPSGGRMRGKMDKSRIIKMLLVLAVITIAAGGLLRMFQRNSMSLAEYEKLNGGQSGSEDNSDSAGTGVPGTGSEAFGAGSHGTGAGADISGTGSEASDADSNSADKESGSGPELSSETENLQGPAETVPPASTLIGASLNGSSRSEDRITYEEGFYYEPISDNLRRYITGVSYPGVQTPENTVDSDMDKAGTESAFIPEITLDELRYVHILHYDFDGNPAEGELICNEYIAQDLVEIFYELYCNEYRLEKILLIDEYDGDDVASMEDNNTSCFNYRVVAGSTHLSKHAYGLAIDVNPLYNPYVTYGKSGSMKVSPASGESYADRTLNFPYKIDEEDLCYKLFIRHGFTWGGNWNHSKDYQHFQKAKP